MSNRRDPDLIRAEIIGGVFVLVLLIAIVGGSIALAHFIVSHWEIFS